MKFGVILPGGSAVEQLEQAVLAEESGWDGVFAWEAAYGVDPWGLLTAIAARTSRVRLGTMLTPLPWRRPWKVASQVATLDQISGGRAILAVGLGATETDLPRTGEELDLRTRAAMLDEGIDLIRELWAEHSQYHGVHYDYECARDDLAEVGRPVQERIPIWVVGAWPRPKSMRRVLRCDGVLPQFESGGPEEMRVLRAWLTSQGVAPGFDVIAEGETTAGNQEDDVRVAGWAEAGATWWLETRWEMPHHSAERMQQVRERIAAGPPSN
jgi:alkanesulfonate monooxygenase SsuD/methylene tetrahydromethanopterin reductase-like flavin-dependent oxidoreductase (luciferase family)